jgi:hypothetical protein
MVLTPATLADTMAVPDQASATLEAIFKVAAPCRFTAPAGEIGAFSSRSVAQPSERGTQGMRATSMPSSASASASSGVVWP